MNLVYGLSEVSFKDYSIGLIAILPGTILFCGLGSLAGDIAKFQEVLSGREDPLTWALRFIGLIATLAAVFIGGTPYWGGLGTIVGAVFGVGVIAYMEIGVVAVGMSGTWRQFFNGLIILLALLGHRLHGDRVR